MNNIAFYTGYMDKLSAAQSFNTAGLSAGIKTDKSIAAPSGKPDSPKSGELFTPGQITPPKIYEGLSLPTEHGPAPSTTISVGSTINPPGK